MSVNFFGGSTGLRVRPSPGIAVSGICVEVWFKFTAMPTDFVPLLTLANSDGSIYSGIYARPDGNVRLFANWDTNNPANPVLGAFSLNTWYAIAINGYSTKVRAVMGAGTPAELTQTSISVEQIMLSNNFVSAGSALRMTDWRIYNASRSDGQIQTDFQDETPPGTPIAWYPLGSDLSPDIAGAAWAIDAEQITFPGTPQGSVTYSSDTPVYAVVPGGNPPTITSNNPTTDGLNILGGGSITTDGGATTQMALVPASGATLGPFPATGASTGPWSGSVSIGGLGIPPGVYKSEGVISDANGQQATDSVGTVTVVGVSALFKPPLTYAPARMVVKVDGVALPATGGNISKRAGAADFEIVFEDETGVPFDNMAVLSTIPGAAAALTVTNVNGAVMIHPAASLANTTTTTINATYTVGSVTVGVSFTVTVDSVAQGIITKTVPLARAGLPYSFQLLASGSPVFTKVSGPAWLTVSPTGLLGGTPPLSDKRTEKVVFEVSLTY